MKLYHTTHGIVVGRDNKLFGMPRHGWDELINAPHLPALLAAAEAQVNTLPPLLAPLGSQEVWAAGVTYLRSREARQHEVKTSSGGEGDFYARVYEAERPELFFKSVPRRVSVPGGMVRIRRDAKWQVPEPELAVIANCRGEIVGWTVGNDMSARDIEGENPLYLPQAKVWEGSCALGPAMVVGPSPGPETEIAITIRRGGKVVVSASTSLAKMKRKPAELVEWLFRECAFPSGVVLLTGTGIVPPDDFSLQSGDIIQINISPAGELTNTVA
ncbi:MAG: fumarylacetoacetate hydrolase family protein [Methylacidiphilales bacterium]|nr:fumarylacetoacetate hydrolase family protein [Candidatus Methylacidiphilales bacterium]